jgi:RNA polymerase sigma factor (sigma-70 family)
MQNDESDELRWARAAAGDRDAADALFAAYETALYRFFAARAQEPIDQLVQQTDVLWRENHPDVEVSCGLARLFRVACRVLTERGVPLHVSPPELAARWPSSFEAAAEPTPEHEREQLRAAFIRLSHRHRLVLELYYWVGLDAKEIAALLDVSDNMVRGRIARARSELRNVLFPPRGSPC